MFAGAGLFVIANQPLTGIGHLKLIFSSWYLPAIGVMLAFVPLFWAPGNQWWWLLRIGLSSLIGVLLLVGFMSKAGSYDDIRDVGVGIGFVLFVGLGWAILLIMVLVVTLFLLSHASFLPALKWILIVFVLFLLGLRILWWLT